MSRTSTHRKSPIKSFFSSLFQILLGALIALVVIVAVWKVFYHFSGEETRARMENTENAFIENVKVGYDKFLNFIGKDEEVLSSEVVEFEGVKLGEVAKLNMLDYIDFTVPYTWTFGRIDVEDAATEEAIAITGDNVVMTISLRNVEMDSTPENIKWTEEAMVHELETSQPTYAFKNAEMFEEEAAIVEGVNETKNAKLYVVSIPVEDKTIFVSYSFLKEDWNAELYFTTAISQMLEKR
ncbi:MAG: hypothetical protein IJO08_02925 [Clostridia bacterium]|nr:hypothetical protein [Clostridia bacterium]